MISLSVFFSSASDLDFALGELKNKIKIKNVLIDEFKADNSLPVNYPVTTMAVNNSSDYLDGLPHITEGGPLHDDYLETEKRNEVKLTFSIENENEALAKGILRKFDGYEIKLCH